MFTAWRLVESYPKLVDVLNVGRGVERVCFPGVGACEMRAVAETLELGAQAIMAEPRTNESLECGPKRILDFDASAREPLRGQVG